MPIMTWDKTLDIGVEAMNEDHREILNAMNDLFDAHARGTTGVTVNKLVARLGEVCILHFAREEEFMRQTGYPGFIAHKALHEKLLTRYRELSEAIRIAGGVANPDFFNFLKFWLNSHIKGLDTKYAAHALGHAHGHAH
jgi:hemerythrin